MKTMTRIENVEVTPGGNIVVTVLGGEKVGTTDKTLGEDAMLAFHDKGHDMWDMEYEQRGGKLYLLGFEPVLAPPELGGPADPAPSAADAESATSTEPDDIVKLEELTLLPLKVTVMDAKIEKIAEFLEATTEFTR